MTPQPPPLPNQPPPLPNQPPPLPPQPPPPPRSPPAPPAEPAKKRRARWPWVVFLVLPLTCFVSMIAGAALSQRTKVPDGAVLKLKLEGPLKDRGRDWVAELSGKAPLTVLDVLDVLKKAAADKRIK